MNYGTLPAKQGLYDPANEHDACGVGFVVNIKGSQSNEIIQHGLTILDRLTHRGAVGADPKAGDGAGILMQIPHDFLVQDTSFNLPNSGEYGVGMCFFPKDKKVASRIIQLIENVIEEEQLTLLGWRDVPVDNSGLGVSVIPTEPTIKQLFIGFSGSINTQEALERKLFVVHKIITARTAKTISDNNDFYICSMSTRTIVYKGMLLSNQVGEYYLDLQDKRTISALALVHQRFSTNTFPTWNLAHPFRMIAHNGEINTMRGNVNWMAARRHAMSSDVLGDDLNKIWPVIPEGQSDSACFDNALELLIAGGYDLAHAMMMLIPEAWSGNKQMDSQLRDFYEYHAAMVEPWDGPAAVAFTDGRQIGATLDRNGLRPARYIQTSDDLVVMASEMGVLQIPEEKIIKKWRLQPGKMLLIDLEQGRIIDDAELKQQLSNSKPYRKWLDESQLSLDLGNLEPDHEAMSKDVLLDAQQAFGYTQEDLKIVLPPMINTGMEGTGSMGTDTPPAVLSNRSRHLSHYFKQNFAQVTNPPIDPIREEIVMSLMSLIGPRPNLLGVNEKGHSGKRLVLSQPILSNESIEGIRRLDVFSGSHFNSKTLPITYSATEYPNGMEDALKQLCQAAEVAVNDRFNILILSDRDVSAEKIPIPALLATSAVHQHLVKMGLRNETGLVVETGSAIEIHHFATLAGYGAEAINPWLAFDTIDSQLPTFTQGLAVADAHKNYIKAVGKGLKKVMSKMGISTYQSYCGAQIFDVVGLSSDFVNDYFKGTTTSIEGIDFKAVEKEAISVHSDAYGDKAKYQKYLDVGGEYAFRFKGENHCWTPDSIAKLQHAVRAKSASTFAEYSALMDEQNEKLLTLRGLMEFKWADKAIPLDEVESASDIVKRFSTGAMSFGSISYEAHSTLAIAMNAIGGKSNTGEGGEEPARYKPLADGHQNPERSAIKQVASGRFGVTTDYLVNSDEIQIKMAQGAKPGEGGQLPGHKVDERIGKVRNSTPGVGLISPPPHHDIYSIEDLAQLIHDLKNVQPKSRISVKLVSEVGVGTVAAGVSKTHADHLTISGYDGGTGASPMTSLKHAGSPWEIGLAETQQTLVMNQLRDRISVQVDGGIRTGRDVVIGALLGADEIGFATAPLIAEGCIMMRKCHLNTCPVGIATQNPELRKRFKGKPEHVINYFFFIAEEVRVLMAKLGFRHWNEMVGQVNRLSMRDEIDHWKAQGLDYSKLLYQPEVKNGTGIYQTKTQNHGLDKALDNELIAQAAPALEKGERVTINVNIENSNRTFGTMLSGRVAEQYGNEGLPDDTIRINAKGTAGQSLGAWLAKGITLKLKGEGNDYVGKGLSGGRLIIMPPSECAITAAEDNIIVGNTVLYGATAGECYFNGVAGERFGVRNSGAIAVVEGIGDHGCEYMTGGIVVCLGDTGRNFAAGMSGGIAYVYDPNDQFKRRCNKEMVDIDSLEPDHSGADINDMLSADETRLKQLIKNHLNETGSALAKRLLADWEETLPNFVKIMPRDYRNALLASQEKNQGK